MHTKNENKRFVATMLTAVALTIIPILQPAAAQTGSNALEAIEVAAMPGNQVQLRLRMSDTAPRPEAFSTENPPRIAIDLPDTHWAADGRRTEIGIGAVRNVVAAEAQGKVRLVVNLSNMIEYTTRTEGNNIFITLGSHSAAPLAAAAQPEPKMASPTMPSASAAPSARTIESIDFRRGENGEGRIMVDLTDPRTTVDLAQEGDQIVLEFKNVQLPDALVQRYDVTDFATPVTTIDAVRRGNDARIVVRAAGDYEQLAYQADDKFTLEIKAIEEEPEAVAQREKEYTGERLTLNFQDLEVRAFFSIIADLTGLNVVVSDSVSGNITLRLQNVPWDQAMDIVLRTKGLAMRENGNVILVAPAMEIAEMERLELESRQQIQQLAPLRSEFIQVNYAKATDLATLIQGSEDSSILSERGSVSVDERTNTLLVQDTAENLADVRRMVQMLDIPVRQVLIESRIVIATDDFNRELGVRLGTTFAQENGSDGIIGVTGTSSGTDTMVNSALDNFANTGQVLPVETPGIGDRFNVNMPISSPAGSIALAVLGDSYLVDLELSALQAEGRGELVSTPRVVTANQRQATIRQGVEIPYQQASASGATTITFKEAVLLLQVTPQITPDNRIIMDLVVTNDTIGENVPVSTGGFVPSIDTREVATQVLVNNGDTVVLGGIYETSRIETISKVPFLGDIPGLGLLFRTRQEQADKSELLIFVTPKILDESVSVN